MEEEGIVLNLHGEVPSSAADNVTVMNAEARFLPVLRSLAEKYPRLRIVLEHCTTADAVEAVRSLGENVAGTIVCVPYLRRATTNLLIRAPPKTAHHLSLLVDDWAANVVRPGCALLLLLLLSSSLPPTDGASTTTANPPPNRPRTAAPCSTPW